MKVYLITYKNAVFDFLPKMTLSKEKAIEMAKRDSDDYEVHLYEYNLDEDFESSVEEIKFTPKNNPLKRIKL